MTTPPWGNTQPWWAPPDSALGGPYSPQGRQETQDFLAQLNSMLAMRQNPANIPSSYPVQAGTNTDAPTTSTNPPELVGRAVYWGIPHDAAAAMPQDQLLQLIQAAEVQGHRAPSLMDVGAYYGNRALYGGAEGLLSMAEQIPFIGEHIAKSAMLQRAHEYLGSFSEYLQRVKETQPASIDGLNAQSVDSGVQKAGGFAALTVPAMATWELGGALGKVLPFAGRITSPIVRVAARGGFAGWAVGGRGLDQTLWPAIRGDATPQELEQIKSGLFNTAAGAGLTVGGEMLTQGIIAASPGVAAASQRIARTFNGAWADRVSLGGMPVAGMPGELTPHNFSSGIPDNLNGFEIPVNQAKIDIGPDMSPHEEALYHAMNDTNLPEDVRRSASAMLNDLTASRRQSQVFQSYDEANAMAAQMTKQALAIESSAFPTIAAQAQPNEVSVALGTHFDNPGGTNVIPGVLDPAAFVQGLAPTGSHIRFASKPGSAALDAIFSDQPVTDEMVGQYEKYGVFAGQRVITARGVEGVVVDFNKDRAWVKPMMSGEGVLGRYVPVNELIPHPVTPGVQEVPKLWDEFNLYADQRTTHANSMVGYGLSPERLAQWKIDNLPQYMDDFLTQAQINSPAERSRIKEYFNQRFVEAFRGLDPEETARNDALTQQAAVLEDAAPVTPQQRLDMKAAAQGFLAIPNGKDGFQLLDLAQVGVDPSQWPTAVHFPDHASAELWLTRVHRELPDISPPSDVPGELAQQLPGAGPILEPESPNHEQLIDLQGSALRQLADESEAEHPNETALLRAQVEQAAASGDLGKMQSAWDYAFDQFQPTRARMLEMERHLAPMGGQVAEIKPFQRIYDPVQTQQIRYRNAVYPYLERGSKIAKVFPATDVRDGSTLQLWAFRTISEEARVAAAEGHGYGVNQLAAFKEIDNYVNELGGPDAADNIASYLTKLRQRQALPLNERAQFEMGDVHPAAQPFADFASAHGLQIRALDLRVFLNTIARSQMFKQHLAPTWEAANELASQVSNVQGMEGLGQYLKNWLYVVKNGYDPRPDMLLRFMKSVGQAVVPGLTEAQVRALYSGGMNITQQSLLGWKLPLMARDALRPLLAVNRTGWSYMADAMRRYATASAAEKSALFEEGFNGAWVTRGLPPVSSPGAFEDPLVYVEGEAAPVPQRAPSVVYRGMQRAADVVRDYTPQVSGTAIDPLYLLTRQFERMRLITGMAMKSRAMDMISAFREAGAAGDVQRLLQDTRATTFDNSIRERFLQHITAGDDEGAANFLARQVTHSSVFMTGLSENPEVGRTLAGRVFMQMGNFSTQFYQYMMENLRNGTMADKARFLGTMGSVAAVLKIAKAETGWNFDKWQFYHGLTFTGGPWTEPLADLITGAHAVSRIATSETGSASSSGRGMLDDASKLGQVAGAVGQYFNPLGGALNTYAGIRQGLESPTPGSAIARSLLTGERGAGPDWEQQFRQTFGEPHPIPMPQPDQMHPMSSATRAAGFGLPAQAAPAAPTLPPGNYWTPDTANIVRDPNAQPGTANWLTPDLIDQAREGNASARQQFEPDELALMDSTSQMRREDFLPVFAAYMQTKHAQEAARHTGHNHPGLGGQQ